jgi:tetracycline repressor-like protein
VHKLGALARAQAEGGLDRSFPPATLLALVLAVAAAWGSATPSHVPEEEGPETSHAARRRAVVEATRRLLAPPD